MRRPTVQSKAKHTITWDQFREFAAASGRDLTHAFRVFKGERASVALATEFQSHFGFAMSDSVLAGHASRKRRAAA